MLAAIPFGGEGTGMRELPPKVQKAAQSALRRARQWRCPPHWDGNEWHKELDAIARAAAFEACCYFDEQQSIPLFPYSPSSRY
jgi:hypothetical protein